MQMNKKYNDDAVSFDLCGFDLNKLHKQISVLGITSLIVYGVGANANSAYTMLSNMGVNVKYFVDLKAEDKRFQFHNREVVTPGEFIKKFSGEYIIVSPNQHKDIVNYLELNSIPNEKIITPFFIRNSINVNFCYSLLSPSTDIDYCKVRPAKPVATFATIVYNTPEYMFRRAIESVLRQTYKDFIYVIIINGATDNTFDIASQYAELDARIVIVNLDVNHVWTDKILLNAIKENVFGDYWCQLDSDDYYDERFLEITLNMATDNNADIVCVRTMAFCENKDYSVMTSRYDYFAKQSFFIYADYSPSYFIGHHNIIRAYANFIILGTFWGRLYKSSLMHCYLNSILDATKEERELFFRLDVAMTYQILGFSERFFNSDKVLHFASYSERSNTYSTSPVEWLMSFWYAYEGIKKELNLWYKKTDADNLCRRFLNGNLPWMVTRHGILENAKESSYKEKVMQYLGQMYNDVLFQEVLSENIDKKPMFREFYEKLRSLVINNEA